MNKKGQALVEFILIIPVFIMLLFCIIDFGRIYYTKIVLTNKINDAIDYYKDGKTVDDIKNKMINSKDEKIIITNDEGNLVKFTYKKSIDIITPGLSNILGKKYNVEEIRTIDYE